MVTLDSGGITIHNSYFWGIVPPLIRLSLNDERSSQSQIHRIILAMQEVNKEAKFPLFRVRWRSRGSGFLTFHGKNECAYLQGGPSEFYSGNWSSVYAVWEIGRDLSNSIRNSSISGVTSSWTTLYLCQRERPWVGGGHVILKLSLLTQFR